MAIETQLIHQREELLYPDIIFNRPISGLSRLQVAVFGGSKKSLSTLSELYTTIALLGVSPTCVVEHKVTAPDLLPVGSMMLSQSKKTNLVAETAEVLGYIDRANLAIVAPEVELGSSMQILFEKLWSETNTPLMLTDEVIGLYSFMPSESWRRDNVMVFLSNEALIKLAGILKLPVKIRPGRGVYNVLSVVDAVSDCLNAHVAAYGADMVVVRDHEQAARRGIIHLDPSHTFLRGLMIGLLSGLVADFRIEFSNLQDKTLVAGYLYNSVIRATQPGQAPTQNVVKSVVEKELQ